MLMCDQDNDGSHIKGLIINFFHYFWPHLLSVKGFLQQFITPIVKVRPLESSSRRDLDLYGNSFLAEEPQAKPNSKGKGKKKVALASGASSATLVDNGKGSNVLEFYSSPEYLAWKASSLSEISSKMIVKYYKGLGTNTAKEGREYFQNLAKHRKIFTYEDADGIDGVDSATYTSPAVAVNKDIFAAESRQNSLIDMAFSKERVDDRRNWLVNNYEPEHFINPNKPTVTYDDFVNKELIMFSTADNLRSIPCVIDGLKPSQRKVMSNSIHTVI